MQLGQYRHFKGEVYHAITVVNFADGVDLEPLVIYQNIEGKEFARTVENFNEIIERDGKFIKRFRSIHDKRGFESLPQFIQSQDNVPQRATEKSAGYDIRANEFVIIKSGEMKAIKTGITAYMQDNEFLDLRIRSGLAYKHQLTLQNDAGVIDADYYGKEIGVMIRNEGPEDIVFNVGDRIAQCIFLNYLTTTNDNAGKKERLEGFGHTGLK